MANKDQKKLSTAIFSSMKPSGEEVREMPPITEDGSVLDNSIALEACAEDLARALEAKDAKSIVAVVKDLFYLLQEEMAAKPEEPEEPEEA